MALAAPAWPSPVRMTVPAMPDRARTARAMGAVPSSLPSSTTTTRVALPGTADNDRATDPRQAPMRSASVRTGTTTATASMLRADSMARRRTWRSPAAWAVARGSALPETTRRLPDRSGVGGVWLRSILSTGTSPTGISHPPKAGVSYPLRMWRQTWPNSRDTAPRQVYVSGSCRRHAIADVDVSASASPYPASSLVRTRPGYCRTAGKQAVRKSPLAVPASTDSHVKTMRVAGGYMSTSSTGLRQLTPRF